MVNPKFMAMVTEQFARVSKSVSTAYKRVINRELDHPCPFIVSIEQSGGAAGQSSNEGNQGNSGGEEQKASGGFSDKINQAMKSVVRAPMTRDEAF